MAQPIIVTGAAEPPDTSASFKTGGYGQMTDAGNRLWAAAELWETTGEAPFLVDFESRIDVPKVDANFDWDFEAATQRQRSWLQEHRNRQPVTMRNPSHWEE